MLMVGPHFFFMPWGLRKPTSVHAFLYPIHWVSIACLAPTKHDSLDTPA